MTTTAEQMRAWQGPVIFSFGFRPFFLGAAVWAMLSMLLWIPMLSGHLTLPTAFDPVSWHAHEFLFGYLVAVVAGFLLTAVPNWTGRLPVVGWPLAGLAALWLAGRAAVALSAWLPPLAVALADLAMPLALSAVLAREIVAGRNWRNLPVLGLLAVLIAGNTVFHAEAAAGGYPAAGYGLRIGLAGGLTLIALIGGRIVPSFTRNWLVRRGPGRLPVPPMQRLDKVAVVVLIAALLLWVALPQTPATAIALIVAGLLHLLRLSRWAGDRTAAEPLVWVLHAGYAFLPAGAIVLGGALLAGDAGIATAAQHLWMAGAIGLMTVAVMTRASLGHTGQDLTAGRATLTIYLALIAAVFARLAAGLLPDQSTWLYHVAGTCWILAFGGFALFYGPALLRPRSR